MSGARDIEQRAAEWVIRREEPDWSDEDASELERWLAASWAHKAAYWRLELGWREADRIGALGLSEDHLAPAWKRALRGAWRPAAGLALAASLAGLALFGASQGALAPFGASLGEFPDEVERQDYAQFSTPVGGRRNIRLADGSTVELNTRSALRTSITRARRVVWLDQGEAFFDVQRKSGKSFIVHAGDRQITVLGTKFSVRVDEGRVLVSVLEGRVRIDSTDPDVVGGSAVITRGGTAIAATGNTLLIRGSEQRVQRALAWRAGILSFDQAPLAQVASELNRYNVKQIVIEDSAIAGIRIGGSFRADNTDALLRLLRDAYGFRVVDDGETARILQ